MHFLLKPYGSVGINDLLALVLSQAGAAAVLLVPAETINPGKRPRTESGLNCSVGRSWRI